MKIAGNLSLCFAGLLLLYSLTPHLPGVRAAIMRSDNGFIGSLYALFFVLMPQFLRLLIAFLTLWGLLIIAMVAAIRAGGLDWLGFSRLTQCLLVGAACFCMAEITVLIGLASGDALVAIPEIMRAMSPWAAWALPLIVGGFAFATLNPGFTWMLAPWVYRGPLIAAFVLCLPIGGVLFARWITPVPTQPAAPVGQ